MFRESVFACSCRLNDTVRAAHIRAWDEDEAAELFLQELNEEGIFDVSELRVTALPSARGRAASEPSDCAIAAEGSAA